MAPERQIPRFAPMTLQRWFAARGERNLGGPKVVLWPDTFNNHMHVEVGVAAVEALEEAGFHVTIPRGHLCCGRPLYDYGMLDLARRYLQRVLDSLRDEIRAGVPLVGIEPSCLAVFKDELPKLMPNMEDGNRLTKQAFHFAQFLEQAEGYEPPLLARKAIGHGHCHESATEGVEPMFSLLRKMGADLETPDSGCCGMAGSWGYEAEHYGISLACGERALLPAVREAPPEALIVADGFSCKTQIEEATDRRALHVAQVLRLAREHGPQGPGGPYPESAAPGPPRPSASSRITRSALVAAGAGALAGAAVAFGRPR
jgi:Fe-S oxidoreductase